MVYFGFSFKLFNLYSYFLFISHFVCQEAIISVSVTL